MAVPVPSISCCVLNNHNLFYQIQNALAFNLSLDIYANTKQYHLLGGIVVVLGDPVKEGVSGGPEELVSAASRGVDVIKLFYSSLLLQTV
jgi:hypothetical protein